MPGPQAPWNEIVPRLWMGGHHWTGPTGEFQPAIVGSEFDLVISLIARTGHGPDPDTEHLMVEIPDGPLTAEQIDGVHQLAHTAARAVRNGRNTLIRCHWGYNRSGLVVGQALIELGQEAETAIRLIRQRRSSWALNNARFTEYLTTGLDVAYLLTGLQG